MTKPRVFIGSSSEGLAYARAFEEQIVKETEPVLWTSDVFKLSKTSVESLEQELETVEFAVLIVTPDDPVVSRGVDSAAPRDNVIFELGLFIGKLGRDRTFIVRSDQAMKLPTDLLGVTVASFDSARSNGNQLAAVSPAASKVMRSIKSAPRRTASRVNVDYGHILFDEEQFLRTIASWALDSKFIAIALQDTSWVWKLFPTLMSWRLAGIPVSVVATPIPGNPVVRRQERTRRGLLKGLGASYTEQSSLSLKAVVREATYPTDTCAVVCSDKTSDYEPFAISYDGKIHTEVAYTLLERIRTLVVSSSEENSIPELQKIAPQVVIEKLRVGVEQYSSEKVSLTWKSIPTKDLFLMSPFARSSKYAQIEKLHKEYERRDLAPFEPTAVKMTSGTESIVTPPVVEVHSDVPVVIEGTTRATFCMNNGIGGFLCVVAEDVTEELPGTPCPIGEVTITQRSLPPGERMKGFEYKRFRHIERAMHPY